MREFFSLSYRRTEALLVDSPQWLVDVGLTKVPDHNTLWRAFDALVSDRRCNRMLDLLAEMFAKEKLLTLRRKPLALDSTRFERRHRSAHYDRRCRHMVMGNARKRPGSRGLPRSDERGSIEATGPCSLSTGWPALPRSDERGIIECYGRAHALGSIDQNSSCRRARGESRSVMSISSHLQEKF